MRIAIGSTNPVKCSATRAVLTPLFPDAEYVCRDVPSGVSVQPWGDVETRTGALNRARAALEQTGADLAVGLEGGVQEGLELGAAMDHLVHQHNTKHQNGAIGILTNNLETRQSAYETIIRLALAPFQNPAWYPVSSNP
jgi:non-canonical (house-cleaning) NTP pyrophosphatase